MSEKKSNSCPLHAINRREFLKDIGKGAVTVMAAPALYPLMGCELEEIVEDGFVRLAKPSAPPAGSATVSIDRKNSIKSSVQNAIEMAGGLSEINSGDTVLLKPNIVGAGLGTRPYTHPAVIEAVIQEVKTRTGAKNITLAEASYKGPGSNGTTANAKAAGILDIVESEGINFIAWDEDAGVEYVQIDCPDIQNIGYTIELPKTLVDGTFDHYINLPMLKNHVWQNAGFTCCIKNFVGTMRLSNRGMKSTLNGHNWIDLARGVAELNLSTPNITMNIVDALSVVLKFGPLYPTMQTHDANLIIASKDRVAADTMSLAVLRYYASLDSSLNEPYQHLSVWEQPQITRALELNLGRTAANIEYTSDGVSDIAGILEYWS